MNCPDCGYDNIEGQPLCESCGGDLTTVQEATSHSLLEANILESSLSRLGPREPMMVGPDATVEDAVSRMAKENIGAILVGTPSNVLGIFTERDLMMDIALRWDEVRTQPITKFMTHEPEQLEQSTPIAYAINRMAIRDCRHIPVVQNYHTTGMISVRDVLDYVCEWYPKEVAAEV